MTLQLILSYGAGTGDIRRICGQQVFLLSDYLVFIFRRNVTQGSSPHSTTYANMLIPKRSVITPNAVCL